MREIIKDIRKLAKKNEDFRREVLTNEHCQVVLMSIAPGEDIGEEVHADVDQLLVIVDGDATVVLDEKRKDVKAGAMIAVPAGTRHNVINADDDDPLKLYTIYAPPETAPGTVHATKADALAAHA